MPQLLHGCCRKVAHESRDLDGGTHYHREAIYGDRYRSLFDRAIYVPDLVPADLEDVGLLIVPGSDRSGPPTPT